jgi:hypothetical protein
VHYNPVPESTQASEKTRTTLHEAKTQLVASKRTLLPSRICARHVERLQIASSSVLAICTPPPHHKEPEVTQ